MRDLVSDEAWLAALLTVEATLARVQADAGLIPASSADAIAGICRPERYDIAALGAAAAESGNPVIPLVVALRDAVGPAVAPDVHSGATSQDVLDSAAMLIAGRAVDALLGDLDGAIAAAAGLARTHRDTPMAGRTLLQRAVPVTFGRAGPPGPVRGRARPHRPDPAVAHRAHPDRRPGRRARHGVRRDREGGPRRDPARADRTR
ncbi:MAG: hypothetical protein AUI10_10195 [Actinobacteria bacterium 13_2_20CM_2_72_6]|nr:MAG: hypothetical protein AUI10_10195 [Actinobacteria bacterium 13_2_20CM_2_72_6]